MSRVNTEEQKPSKEHFNELPPSHGTWYQLFSDVKRLGRLEDWNNNKVFEFHYRFPLTSETDQSFHKYRFEPSFANRMIVNEIDDIVSNLNEDSFSKLRYISVGGSFTHDDERFKEIRSLFLNLHLFVKRK